VTRQPDELRLDRTRGEESPNHPDAEGPWTAPPTIKERSGVQRAVERLLDALAPKRTAPHAARRAEPLDRQRASRGCIVQAPVAAVSVSWFPDAVTDTAFGELQIIAWWGVVSRPGSAHRAPGGATIGRELMLRPEGGEASTGHAAREWLWRADDGSLYDADLLATRA
jgi:hypothetical protein